MLENWVKSIFVIRAPLSTGKKLEVTLNAVWHEMKNTVGKFAVVVNIDTLEATRFEFWMKWALVMVKTCVLYG